MENLAAAMRELALSVASVKATVDESHSLLWEIGAWNPPVAGALQEMRSNNTPLRQQLGRVALNPTLGFDPSMLQLRATPAALEGGVRAAVEFVSSPTVGGREAVASSLSLVDPAIETGRRGALVCKQGIATLSTHSAPPWASHIARELDADRVGDSSYLTMEDSDDLNTVSPTKCSMRCSSANNDGVQPRSVFTTSPAPVIASPYPTLQQLGTLKLDTHMPTTCSTGVIDIGIDALRAQQDMKTVMASLLSTHAAAAVIPASLDRPPDQHRLLLDCPPPWPLWMELSMCCRTPGSACLLPVRSRPLEQCHMLWLLPSSTGGQAKSLWNMKSSYTSSSLTPTTVCDYVIFSVRVVGAATRLKSVVSTGCSEHSIWMLTDYQWGLEEDVELDGPGGTLIVHMQALHNMGNTSGSFLVGEAISLGSQSFYKPGGVHRTGHMKFVHEPSWWPARYTLGGTPANSGKQITLVSDQLCSLILWSLAIQWNPSKLQQIICQVSWPSSEFHSEMSVPNGQNESYWILDISTLANQLTKLHAHVDLAALHGDSISNLAMLSITSPWDPGVGNELSIEVLQSELVKQHICGEVHWQPGKRRHNCVHISLKRRLGDKMELKKGVMSRPVLGCHTGSHGPLREGSHRPMAQGWNEARDCT